MLFGDLEQAEREKIRAIYVEDLNHQRTYFISVNAEIRRLILFLNAGSAVALISFMAGSAGLRNATASWVALASFAAGITFLSISYAFGFHILHHLLMRTSKDLTKTWGGDIDLLEYEKRRAHIPLWIKLTGGVAMAATYAAWICWAGGVVTTIVYLRSVP